MKITFDIGGTNTRVASFDNGNHFLTKLKFPTPQQYEEGIDVIGKAVEELRKNEKVDAVAIAIAGALDKLGGRILTSPNLKDWEKKPLVYDMTQTVGASRVILENDAAAAAIGEARMGSGKGKHIVAFLTLSTGVGGARVINGSLDVSAMGFEPGSLIVNMDETMPIGNFVFGSLESYVSGTGFRQRFWMAPETCEDPSVWQQYARWLAVGLANIVDLWSPNIIVLGGGMVHRSSFFLEQTRKLLAERIPFPQPPPIVIGALGDEAGLWGGITLLQ